MTKKLRTLRLSIYQHVLIKKNKCRLSVLICKRNEVNWAKNDRVRAVFVAEVKIPENEQF